MQRPFKKKPFPKHPQEVIPSGIAHQPWMHHLYVDGSFRPDNAASLAFLIYHEGPKRVIAMERYAYWDMTINQMELLAIGKALETSNSPYVTIYSDSMYAISALSLWRKSWVKTNWITPTGQPVKNREIIESVGKLVDDRKYVRWVKIKAHTGDPFNTVVDFLAHDLTGKMLKDSTIVNGRYFG